MPDKIESQIEEIIRADRSPKPTILHYLVWAIFGLMALIFAILLLFVLFILLRTVFLFGVGSLLGSI